MKISVIIPTYNRAEMVCRCVQSILDTHWPNLEIIVVDDCSPDSTGTKLQYNFGGKIKYIRNEKILFRQPRETTGLKSPLAITCFSLTTTTS